MPGFHHCRWDKTLTLGILFTCGLSISAWADTAHFRDGRVLEGKIHRVTGDIVEFKLGHGYFGRAQDIQRLQLTNRRDIVETTDGIRHFGEIIYVDTFSIDLKTATGLRRINRMDVIRVVLASPVAQPETPEARQLSTQPGTEGNSATFSANNRAASANQSTPHEDQDAIPDVNQTP